MQQFRQGDVFLERVTGIPVNAETVETKGPIVLAEGEVTGHAHRVRGPKAKLSATAGGERFLSLPKPGELVHEEHGTIPLPAGSYRVRQQREYSPEAIRNVAD